MDPETEQQLDDLRRERVAHARRLGVLKERRAAFGPREVPPYIITDIEDVDRAIVEIDAAIAKLLARSLRVEQQRETVADAEGETAVQRLWAYIFSVEDDLRRQLNALLLRAAADDAARGVRQRRQDWFYIGVFVLLLFIAYRVWL